MKFENGEIYTFKLNSGEELVAKILSSEFSTVTVDKPVSMAMTQQGLQLVPSMFSSDPEKNVDINISSIAMSVLCRDDVKKGYLEATTGLDLTSGKQVLQG